MTRHRLNEDDETTIMPAVILPATVEELAAQEREPKPANRTRRRSVVFATAATAVLATAATGWAVTRPSEEPAVAPPVTWASESAHGFVDGFGEASPSPEAPPQPLPYDSPLPGPQPSAVASSPAGVPGQPLASGTAALVAGGQRSLRAGDRPDRYVRQSGGLASLTTVTAASTGAVRQSATFTVAAGLADKACVSFVGVDGAYLRHRDYRIRHERSDGSQLFREDATFCVRPGKQPGTVYLESFNYPGYFIHLRGDELWIDRWQDKDPFGRECAFAVTAPWA